MTYLLVTIISRMSKRVFTLVYFCLVSLALGGLAVLNWMDKDFMFHLFKPLPVLSLALFYFLKRRKNMHWEDIVMSLAIVFAFFGDAFLMYEGAKWFMLGLASFLLTHIGYSLVLFRQGGDYLRKRWWVWLLLLGYGGLLVWIMGKGMDKSGDTGMLIPVMVYAAAIILMALTAINRYRVVPDGSFRWVLVGAMLFVLSDSMLGINKFTFAFPAAGFLILLSYYAAQYFIVFGYLGALDFEKT